MAQKNGGIGSYPSSISTRSVATRAAVDFPSGPLNLGKRKPVTVAHDGGSESRSGSNVVRRRPRVHPDWTPQQRQVSSVIDASWFDVFISGLVAFNTILVVVETDKRASSYSPGHPDVIRQVPDSDAWILALSQTLLLVYSVEISLRLFVYRRHFFQNKWNIFDLAIVGSDVLCETLTGILSVVPEGTLSIVGLLRILRALRFVRAIRTLTLFRELYMMLHGFVSSMRAIFWATVMLAMMLCFWSVIAVELVHPFNQDLAELGVYDGCDRCPYAFSTVWHAMLTFTQQIVAGDSWGVVTIPLMEYKPEVTIPLFMAIFISVDLGVLNLILTVIVDRAAQARAEDKRFVLQQQEESFEAAKKDLLEICCQLDEDNSGMLTKEELMSGFESSLEFAEAMRLMDVQKEDMQNLFNCLDEDGSGDIAYDEFVENLHKMKSQDSQMLLVFLRSTVKEIRTEIHEELFLLKDKLIAKTEQLEIDTKQLLVLAKAAKEQAGNEASKVVAVRPQAPSSADVAAGLMSSTPPMLAEACKFSPPGSGQSTPQIWGHDLARLRQQIQDHLARACRDIDASIAGPRDDRRFLTSVAVAPLTRSPVGEALPAVPESTASAVRNASFLDGCQAPSRSPPEKAPTNTFALA